MSQVKTERRLDALPDITNKKAGEHVAFRARIHHIRPLGTSPYALCISSSSLVVIGAKIVFIILRYQMTTVQGVLTEDDVTVSQNMVRWAEGINRESIVLVEGTVQDPPEDQQEVKSTSIHNVEIKIEKVGFNTSFTDIDLFTLSFSCSSFQRPRPIFHSK